MAMPRSMNNRMRPKWDQSQEQHCLRHFFLQLSLIPQPRSLKQLSRQPRSYSMLHQRSSDGVGDGAEVGEEEGKPEGSKVGEADGLAEGVIDGLVLGILVGNFDGILVGIFVGTAVLTYAMASFSSLDSELERPSVKTGTYTILIASLGRLEGMDVGVWTLALGSPSSSDTYSILPTPEAVGI